MDWFEKLTGFRETGYEETRARLEVEGERLRSRVNGADYGIGELELVSLEALRDRARAAGDLTGRLKARVVQGDVRRMHRLPENADALFQVASQFNLLEMACPKVTPEHGVTRYQDDLTQGPACAIATGAATIYRNYFASVEGRQGQTANRQLNGLADLGAALSDALRMPVGDLWSMQNGYALGTQSGLDAITRHLKTLTTDQIDALRGKLRIGIHRDVEVTEAAGAERPRVSQSFCSALPASYSDVPSAHWEPFATLVLEAAYEATLWATVLNAQRSASNVVFLTRLGGGAFGNDDSWIHSAIRRVLELMTSFELDVRLVSYGPPSKEVLAIVEGVRRIQSRLSVSVSGRDRQESKLEVPMALEDQSEQQIQELECMLLEKVDELGSPCGNVSLIRALEWDDNQYWKIRDRLVDAGKLELGRGKGGSVRRVQSDLRGEEEPGYRTEQDLYEPVATVLKSRWVRDKRYGDHLVEITAKQGRRETGGKWSRPDITVASLTTFPYVLGKHFDITTFEVKPSEAVDVVAVYEALAHRRAATQAYVLFHVPKEAQQDAGMKENIKHIIDESNRHGIGVIVAADPNDYETWETLAEPLRHEPAPEQLNSFIAVQLSGDAKDRISRWIR